MKPENKRMQEYLVNNGIYATPKYLQAGSLKGCWRLYNKKDRWSEGLVRALNGLGFTNYNGKPLDQLSGNGGMFQVFVRGHSEFLINKAA